MKNLNGLTEINLAMISNRILAIILLMGCIIITDYSTAQSSKYTKTLMSDTANMKIKFTYNGSGIAPGEIVRIISVRSETYMVTRVILETMQEQGFLMKNLGNRDYSLKQNTIYQSEIKSVSDDVIKNYNNTETFKLNTQYYYGLEINFQFAIDNRNQEALIKLKTRLMKRGGSSSWSDYTGNYNTAYFENYILNFIEKKLNTLYPLTK
jgi:hypothetical protein